MTVYPLPTLSFTVDEFGISAPSYADILGSLKYSYRSIYGQDVNLDDDTQDGQWLAVLAAGFNDNNAAAIAAFNAQSPSTAQGNGLSSIVKLNGLQRQAQSNSTADILIVGETGTIVTGGVIGDNVGLGTKWNLFPVFTIPDSGEVVVTATCQTPGAITAEPGTLTNILTPTLGWQTANNAGSAAPGAPVEDDATLRQRQSLSQSQPAQTTPAALLGAIKNLPGVLRATYDENDGSSANLNGVPGHSISYIVEGGDAFAIAQLIARKKAMGTGTYGTTTETVIDPAGVPINISFFDLQLQTVTVQIAIDALVGYANTTEDLIKAAVAAYISNLPIGAIVYLNKVEAIAALMNSPLNETFDITSLTLNMASLDVAIPFNYAAVTLVSDIAITVG